MFDSSCSCCLSWGTAGRCYKSIAKIGHHTHHCRMAQLPRDFEVVEEVAGDGVRRPASPHPSG